MKDRHKEYFVIVGRNLRALRKEKGFSQQDLANNCDVDRAKISRIENATEDFMYSTLLEIASALKVEPGKLTGNSIDAN